MQLLMKAIMSHTAAFLDAIAASGMTPPDTILDDGKRHRFSTSGKKKDDTGWYILHGDDRPAGAFGCWRSGISVTWKHDAPKREFTAAERADWKKRIADVEAEREAERAEGAAYAAAESLKMWDAARPDAGHDYLTAKRIPGLGARVLKNMLLIPLRHGPGAIVGLQRIWPDGAKRPVKGTPMVGAYHVIGKPVRGGRVIIVEGYATGVSVHLATGGCVVVAFNAGNLQPVAVKIRAAMPDADIVIGADDDAFTVYPDNHPKAGQPWNPGIEAAAQAAYAVNGGVALPMWTENNRPGKRTDFNDLHADEGIEAVKACFNIITPAPTPADQADSAAVVHAENPVNSSAGAPFPPAGSAAAPAASTGPGAGVTTDEDVFIFTNTPMDTAAKLQAQLPDDGKILFWRGEFYIWNGTRYAVRDAVYLHQIIYHFMARCLTHKTNPKTGDKEVVGFSPKKSAVEDVMHALRAVCFVDLTEPPTWIEQLDTDPAPGDLIPFRNGFLHWPTRTLTPSTPRLFVISALDFDYDPAAPAPVEWLKFLTTLWATDQQSIDALGDMFGYMLTDDTSQQKAFMMIGPPRCGKGTILRVLESMVGQHNRVSPSLTSLGTQFGLQPLVGKRLAMISDARLSGKTDQQPIVENILRISGEDSLTIDRKFLGSWSGKLPTRFILASNETPGFTDASGALPNRFIMFKFTASFLGREDHGLTARLLAELPGIILWALDGLTRLQARGYLIAPDAGRELADEMREQSSPIGAFVAEKCVAREGYSVDRNELFSAWKQWCSDQGMDHPGTIIGFGRRLSAVIPGVGRSQPREDGTRLNLYTGVKIRGMIDDGMPY